MTPPPAKTNSTTSFVGESHQNQMDSEIREMVSALTGRLSNLQNQPHKSRQPLGSRNSHHKHHSDTDDDDSGVRLITLAGSNTGATMRGELDFGKSNSPLSGKNMDPTLDSYVNSNFQAINNSIMMGGSYSSNDPGVHIDLIGYEPEEEHADADGPTKKHGKKHNRKEKEEGDSKSDHHRKSSSY